MALNAYKDFQTCATFKQPRSVESILAVPVRTDVSSATGGVSAFAVRVTTGGAPYGGAFDLWFLHNGEVESAPKQVNRVAVALDRIRRTFGLNIVELAQIFGVERKTIYQWQDGATPRDERLRRMFALERAARSWIEDGFPAPGTQLRVPLVDGRSIFDLLSDDPLDLDAIHFAGSRLHLDAQLSASGPLKDPFD